MRQRRIGTVTLGLTLVAFGVLFLVHIFGGVLDYIPFLAGDSGCAGR